MGNFKEDIARAEALIFDVDGVMSDGGIIPLPDGDFMRKYNAKDGADVRVTGCGPSEYGDLGGIRRRMNQPINQPNRNR